MKTKERIDEAVDKAEDAFWSEIVTHFPEIKTGDFPLDAYFKFKEACVEAVITWINHNK